MEIGTQATRVSTGESGVVLSVQGEMANVAFPEGKRVIPLSDLEVAVGGPDEQLAAGILHDSEEFRIRFLAQYLTHAFRYDPTAGLTNARIEPMPHQISVAHRVMTKHRPRMILADEVGLGKTIEAGLIIKEALARGSAERILVICPASLQYQWQFELQSKFNEEFEVLNGDALRFLSREGVNPWTRADKAITSLNLAVRPERLQEVVDAGWDLIIFDEAHRVRRKRDGGGSVSITRAYELADELKEYTHGILLLTATPMQLDPYEFYSLIELVEPGLFESFGAYESQREMTPELNEFAQSLTGWHGLTAEEKRTVVDTFPHRLEEIGVAPEEALTRLEEADVRSSAIDSLIRVHPLSSVMVRNRKSRLGFESRRVASRIPVTPGEDELRLERMLVEYLAEIHGSANKKRKGVTGFLTVVYRKMLASSSHALRISLDGRLERLRELRDLGPAFLKEVELQQAQGLIELGDYSKLEELGIDWELLEWEIGELKVLIDEASKVRDAKLGALLHDIVTPLLGVNPEQKILIFTGFRKTQDIIVSALRAMKYRVALFNGSMNLDQKESAVRDFRERAQILVSTEAGGEGRNFQFASVLVNYDLPWNPMVVEQRIGRLDRIGQKHQVQIYNLAVEGTIEEQVLSVLEYRIHLFEESIGSLDPILGEIERDIERLVLENSDSARDEIEQLGLTIEQQVQQARHADQLMSDFLMDEASYRKAETNALLDREPMARWDDLRRFSVLALQHKGGSLSDHERGGDAVKLSPQLGDDLRMKSLSLRGAFDPAAALELEEIDFFAFGHEFVDRIIALSSGSEAVTGAYTDPTSGPGTWIELVYRVEAEGLRRSGRLIRHRIASDLLVQSSTLDGVPEVLPIRTASVPSWSADAIAASSALLRVEIGEAQHLADAENNDAKADLVSRRRRRHAYERARLLETTVTLKERILVAEHTGSEGQKRILPAWRGRLLRDEERLKSLDLALEREIEDIEEKRAGVSSAVLSAAVVIGQ